MKLLLTLLFWLWFIPAFLSFVLLAPAFLALSVILKRNLFLILQQGIKATYQHLMQEE